MGGLAQSPSPSSLVLFTTPATEAVLLFPSLDDHVMAPGLCQVVASDQNSQNIPLYLKGSDNRENTECSEGILWSRDVTGQWLKGEFLHFFDSL